MLLLPVVLAAPPDIESRNFRFCGQDTGSFSVHRAEATLGDLGLSLADGVEEWWLVEGGEVRRVRLGED